MFEDHTPIIVDKFMGLYDRGNVDVCPMDHAQTTTNIDFSKNVVSRRLSFSTFGGFSATNQSIKRIQYFDYYNQVKTLVLTYNSNTDESKIYDVLVSLVTPILTIASATVNRATDFSVCSIYNRAYISLHNNVYPYPSGVYVYDGTTCRLAAGSIPSTGLAAADSATAGVVSAGTHAFAYAYETASGHITKPSVITTLTCAGSKKVDLSSIDNGPSGTVKKHILATRKYNTALEPEPEFFFVDEINDNTTTTITINFYDFELVDSADYLFDLLETIPAGLFITSYAGRLVTGSLAAGNVEKLWFSKLGLPESFDEVEGYNIVPTSGLMVNAVAYRDNFYVMTKTRTFYATDNGQEPINWKFEALDGGVGTSTFGISGSFNVNEPANDNIFIASKAGLYLFKGFYSQPYLSWKIDNLWNTLNWSYIVQVLNFPDKKTVYVLGRLGSSTRSVILVGDYSLGLNAADIRWSIFDLGFDIPCIGMYIFGEVYYFCAAGAYGSPVSNASNIYVYAAYANDYEDDFVTAPAAAYKTAQLALEKSGIVYHCAGMIFRIKGSGTVSVQISGLDDVNTTNISPDITLASQPTMDLARKANHKNEKFVLYFTSGTSTTKFELSKIVLYVKALWGARRSNA